MWKIKPSNTFFLLFTKIIFQSSNIFLYYVTAYSWLIQRLTWYISSTPLVSRNEHSNLSKRMRRFQSGGGVLWAFRWHIMRCHTCVMNPLHKEADRVDNFYWDVGEKKESWSWSKHVVFWKENGCFHKMPVIFDLVGSWSGLWRLHILK